MYDRCKFCTKLFIKNKKISNHVNKKLFVAIGQFPPPIRDGILITEKVYLSLVQMFSLKMTCLV